MADALETRLALPQNRKRTHRQPTINSIAALAGRISHVGSLNDLTRSGVFSYWGRVKVTVTIATAATPDTFNWELFSVDGAESIASGSGVSITGSAQYLAHGISITFGATTGHAAGEAWQWLEDAMEWQDVVDEPSTDGRYARRVKGAIRHEQGWVENEDGAVVPNDLAAFNRYYRFDGVNDLINVPDNADLDVGTADFSVQVVFRPDAVTSTQYLLNKEAGGIGYGLYLVNKDLYLRIDDNTTDDSGLVGAGVAEAGVLCNAIVTVDRSGNATCYVNGAEVGTLDVSDAALTLSTAGALRIGSTTAGASFFKGEIYAARLFNRALDGATARAYTLGAPTHFEDYAALSDEHLSETAFTTHVNWAVTNDFDDTGGNATLLWTADQTSTLTQAAGGRAVAGVGGKRYRFTYTVAITTAFDGTVTATITTGFARTATSLDLTAGTHSVEFVSAEGAATGDFVISAVTSGCSAGELSIDDVSLVEIGCVAEYHQGGVQAGTWSDSSGNGNDGTVTSATMVASAGTFVGVFPGGLVVSGGAIDLDPTGTFTLDMDTGQAVTITLADMDAGLVVQAAGGEDLLVANYSAGTKSLQFGNATDNPAYEFLGTGTVTINGDLQVNGAFVRVDVAELRVEDPLMELGSGNAADVLDLGSYANYNDGTARFTGLYRDATDGVWKLFDTLTEEPTTTVNTAHGTYDHGDLQVGGLTVDDAVSVGGGFGSTGVTVSAAGLVQADGGYELATAQSVFGSTGAAETAGANITVRGGTGGATAGVAAGGAGGTLGVAAGAGGAGSAGQIAGAGGALTVAGGAAGANGGAGGANGGALNLRGGAATGAGTNGAVNIGDTNTSAVNVTPASTFAAAADFDLGITVAAGQSILGDGALTVGVVDGAWDLVLQMGDNAGVQGVSFEDSDDVQVARVTSNGDIQVLAGSGIDTLAAGQLDIGSTNATSVVVSPASTFTLAADFDAGLTVAAGQAVTGDGALTMTSSAAAAETAGPQLSVTAGAGGATVGVAAGGVGGQLNLTAGIGGAGGAGQLAGAGGALVVAAGAAGADGGGGGAAGGNLSLRGGNASGAATDGAVLIGDANTSAVTVTPATTFSAAADFDLGLTVAASQAITGDGPLTIGVTAGAFDFVVKMGDAAGAQKVSFVDSASAEQASITSDGDFAYAGHKNSQTFMVNAYDQAPSSAWVRDSSIGGVAKLNASQTNQKLYLRLPFLKIGDEIVSYKLTGDAQEAAAVTLTCKLVRYNLADPLTSTDVAGGAITDVTADGSFDALATLGAVETVATDKMYALEIDGTTGAGDALWVMGAEVLINRK